MDTSEHNMITRSMKKKMEEEGIVPEDTYDENGNFKDFIDYECEEEFDQEMFQKELDRLRYGNKTKSPVKNISMKKKKNSKPGKYDTKLQEILLSYIFMSAFDKNQPKKAKKSKKMKKVVEELKEKEEHSEEEEEHSEEGEEDTNIKITINEIDFEEESDDNDYEIDENNEDSIEDENVVDLESDDSDEEYDDLDEKFVDLTENDFHEDEEYDYFHGLEKEKKEEYIKNIEDINQITKSNIPLKFKVLNSEMDMNTKSIAMTNINKLNDMDVSTGEYCKMDKWINGLINIPFGEYVKLPIDNKNTFEEKREYLQKTYDTLDNAIYGHEDAKTHILQVIGKWIKNPGSQGNVLALQGPMGNGKTTLVKEGISKAINRPFAFITLGGASDSSYFDGHSYTYEGSHWGRIIDILISSKCMNPVIYFDELDKVSETFKGDEIIHLLTHLTDPSQNSLFQDNYFPGVNFDLSKALFIFSFNDESKIDRILKDRMYVINTKGFKPNDKISISRNYLLPELYETFLFSKDEIVFSDETILYVIEKHTNKEEGVRNLKRSFETIISKINIYYLSSTNSDKKVNLNFTIENFSFPMNITNEMIDNLLLKKEDSDKPPEHMYM